MILSGREMLEYIGWTDAAQLVRDAVEATISAGTVTYDLHRQIDGGVKLTTSAFADAVCEQMDSYA